MIVLPSPAGLDPNAVARIEKIRRATKPTRCDLFSTDGPTEQSIWLAIGYINF